MAIVQSKLGNNPLSRGVFSKTSQDPPSQSEKTQESSKKIQESSFLFDSEKEKVNLRIPIELNDWLDSMLKLGKRTHGQKIPKEVWVQAALELLKAMPVDWSQVATKAELQEQLRELERRISKEDS
jgi:hypothetical protein